jgi:hypothetical protein
LFLALLSKLYLFLILSINFNLTYIIFFKMILIFFISNFLFLALLTKLYWFSISSFNSNLWYYIFQFCLHCFDF